MAKWSIDAECGCMAAGTVEVTWVTYLLEDITEKIKGSMLMCDHQNVINIAFSPI